MNLKRVTSWMWAVAMGVAALSATVVNAQAPAAASPDRPMMQTMAAADQKLDELLARMNAATGEAKVAAIAAVVTELSAQRAQMQAHMQSHCAAKMESMHGSNTATKKEPETGPGAQADHGAHHPDK